MVATAGRLSEGVARDFSGGPNLRDAASELAANEVLDSWNITYDERGGIASRLGFAKYNSTQFDVAKLVHNCYWSPLLGSLVTQCGAKLFLGTSNTSHKTFTTEALVTFAELNSLVFAAHPVDGIWSSPDGITWTVLADADAPTTGVTCLAVWQNKLFTGQADGTVRWSAATDGLTWTSTDFNKLWEKDQTGIVALHVGSGQDITGQPGLLAFKNDSMYRISDSETGAYTTVDGSIGTAGPLAVIGVAGKVVFLSKKGIFWWREDQTGAVNASDQLLPLWDPSQINYTQQNLWCAGREGVKAIFSLTRASSTANDLALEYNPAQTWIAPRSDAMSCYTTSVGPAEQLYGGSPTVDGRVYTLNSGGTDDGNPIPWRLQTRWAALSQPFLAQLWQIILEGRGSGMMEIRRDYSASVGDSQPFSFLGDDQPLWDNVNWDEFAWGDSVYQAIARFYSLGACRQFSLLFSGSATTTVTAPQLLGAGSTPTVGEFGLYGITWLFVPLGLV